MIKINMKHKNVFVFWVKYLTEVINVVKEWFTR